MRRLWTLACLVLALTASLAAQDVASFEKKITLKKLDNGLTVLVLRRAEAPVFSFCVWVDAGSAQDPKGGGGLAHMFEHMAFKGTDKIGTTDYAKESAVLAKLEKTYLALDFERRKITGRDDKKIADLEKQLQELRDEADKFVKLNEFGEIIERNGGSELNASTYEDQTVYFYSMPSNRLELMAYLESSRFLHPVYREFYKERDVVMEERRMRVDSAPIGRLIEQMLAAAFTAHPYHNEGIGWTSEVNGLTATEAREFYRTHYTPSNMVLTIVGDVDPQKTFDIVQRYFGRLPKGPKPEEIRTVEPPQRGERVITLKEKGGQLWYLEGYHRPGFTDPDDAVYDAIGDLMSNGRTSRLYRSLVRDKKVALFSGGEGGFPGDKYPNLFIFFAVPNKDKSNKEVADAIHTEIERLKNEDVSDEELQMVKTRAKANLIRSLDNNSGLAFNLAQAQTRWGDWRELFRAVDRIDKVTKADIRRVAQKTFIESNRTVATIEKADAPKPEAGAEKKGGK